MLALNEPQLILRLAFRPWRVRTWWRGLILKFISVIWGSTGSSMSDVFGLCCRDACLKFSFRVFNSNPFFRTMMKNILGQAVYQLTVTFGMMFFGKKSLYEQADQQSRIINGCSTKTFLQAAFSQPKMWRPSTIYYAWASLKLSLTMLPEKRQKIISWPIKLWYSDTPRFMHQPCVS